LCYFLSLSLFLEVSLSLYLYPVVLVLVLLVQKCLIEHYAESYDNQGFPKPSGYVHSVAPHFEHVLELSEELDP
jgi:hypothetical protein